MGVDSKQGEVWNRVGCLGGSNKKKEEDWEPKLLSCEESRELSCAPLFLLVSTNFISEHEPERS